MQTRETCSTLTPLFASYLLRIKKFTQKLFIIQASQSLFVFADPPCLHAYLGTYTRILHILLIMHIPQNIQHTNLHMIMNVSASHVVESWPLALLQVLQNSGSRMFMLRVKTLSARDCQRRNLRKKKL